MKINVLYYYIIYKLFIQKQLKNIMNKKKKMFSSYAHTKNIKHKTCNACTYYSYTHIQVHLDNVKSINVSRTHSF